MLWLCSCLWSKLGPCQSIQGISWINSKKGRHSINVSRLQDRITSIVFADDFVSKLSYGSMMDVKELILAGAEAAKNIGIGQLFWASETNSEVWRDAFKRISECRKRCLESMSNPRVSRFNGLNPL